MDTLGPTFSSNHTVLYLLFVISYLFLFRHTLFGTTQLPTPTALLRRFLTILVMVHTVYSLKLLLSPPVNLFALLGLPLTAPVSAIRIALLERRKNAFPFQFQNKIPQDEETLLSRLSSFEARVVYVKYGPYPLSHCAPCVYPSDFAVFALAPTVLPYLRTLILTSFVTSRPALRPAWRTPALVVLTAAFFAEVWWTVDGQVEFRDGKIDGWTHTHTYFSRTVLLLLVPLLIHILPENSSLSPLPPFIALPPSPRPIFPHQSSDFNLSKTNDAPQTPRRQGASFATGINRSASTPVSSNSYTAPGPSTSAPNSPNSAAPNLPNRVPEFNPNNNIPPSPFSSLNNTLSSLSTTLGTLRVLEWARLAGMRRGEVREKMDEYHETADRNAAYARGDATLRREAEKLGMGYSERGPARRSQFGGRGKTWRGGDPRGLDGSSVLGDDSSGSSTPEGDRKRGGARQRWRGRNEREEAEEDEDEDEEVADSPLRVKARKAAREISQMYLVGMGRKAAGAAEK